MTKRLEELFNEMPENNNNYHFTPEEQKKILEVWAKINNYQRSLQYIIDLEEETIRKDLEALKQDFQAFEKAVRVYERKCYYHQRRMPMIKLRGLLQI